MRINRTERLLNERQAKLEEELKFIANMRAMLASSPKRVRNSKRAVVAASLNRQVEAPAA